VLNKRSDLEAIFFAPTETRGTDKHLPLQKFDLGERSLNIKYLGVINYSTVNTAPLNELIDKRLMFG
jgi:hypothetical protein